MVIRGYVSTDCNEIMQLFYDTVHSINAHDYTDVQLDVWAPSVPDANRWSSTLSAHDTVVAEMDGKIVGFSDLDGCYLDRLYIHKDYQRQGIATALLDYLEEIATNRRADLITVHASITAKSFFEKRGYACVKEQQVCRNGIYLTNFVMNKRFE